MFEILKKSKVMNRDEISLRETIDEPNFELYDHSMEFDAAENANTQSFLEIRQLVEQGRSIVDAISTIVTGYRLLFDWEIIS